MLRPLRVGNDAMHLATNEAELRRLMLASLDGDPDAHRELLTRLSRRLRAFFKPRLVRMGHGEVEAEDLVQETLIAVHTRRHTYDREQPFTPWLYAMARYKFVDYVRRTKKTFHDSLEHAKDLTARDDYGAVESTLDLNRLMGELPPKMRLAIQHVKLDGLSVNEAAERSGMSPSAIKVSVHRGLKALARAMRKGEQP